MNLLIGFFTVLLFGGALSAVYAAIVRPAFIFWIRRQAVAARDDLLLAVKTGEIGSHERAVQPTAAKLDLLISACHQLSIASVVLTMLSNRSIAYEADRDATTGREAGAAMKEIVRRADQILVASMVANSPFFWFFLPPLYALGVMTGKISQWINSVSLSGRNGTHRGKGNLAPA